MSDDQMIEAPRLLPWEQLASDGRYEDAVVTYVHRTNYVSFQELCNRLGSYMPVEGQHAIEFMPNVFVWSGMSEQLADAIIGAVRAERISYQGCSPLVYLYDGGALRLPLVRRPPKQGYKVPHWLPVTLVKPGSPL